MFAYRISQETSPPWWVLTGDKVGELRFSLRDAGKVAATWEILSGFVGDILFPRGTFPWHEGSQGEPGLIDFCLALGKRSPLGQS